MFDYNIVPAHPLGALIVILLTAAVVCFGIISLGGSETQHARARDLTALVGFVLATVSLCGVLILQGATIARNLDSLNAQVSNAYNISDLSFSDKQEITPDSDLAVSATFTYQGTTETGEVTVLVSDALLVLKDGTFTLMVPADTHGYDTFQPVPRG